MPGGRRNNNPNASYLEKLTVLELRKKCTEHGIKYMHILKKSELIQELEKYYKNVLQSFMIKNKYKNKKQQKEETRLIVHKDPIEQQNEMKLKHEKRITVYKDVHLNNWIEHKTKEIEHRNNLMEEKYDESVQKKILSRESGDIYLEYLDKVITLGEEIVSENKNLKNTKFK